SSTNANNDLGQISLNEELDDIDGNSFTFYQRYDMERNFVDANVLAIGAKQFFKNWKANGDLRLHEEFKRYDDQHFDSNDRQEGLFDIRWDPEWDCERWRAELSYRYQIKEYEIFSPLSYKLHRGRAR
ncbi:MAG: hypothetical protein M3R04_09900, partial [bacterium]|nr:hypothetical protein [bacterium]